VQAGTGLWCDHPKRGDRPNWYRVSPNAPGCSEDVQCHSVGGISSSLGIELFPKSAKILRPVVHNWEHSAKEEKVARLHRFDVSAKWASGRLGAECQGPAICTAQV
jgi:hypothetical protein